MSNNAQNTNIPYINWLLFFLSLALLVFAFYDGLQFMVKMWETDEYSHGYLIPMVALFLVWQKQPDIASTNKKWSWLGLPLLFFGFFMLLMGELSAIYIISEYGFLVCLAGLIITFFGLNGTWLIWGALAYLVFMIPLPSFLYKNLSSALQLISSEIGVFVIRLFDISVYLEGNVIDLGVYKLQVVEACSGLRYLFPLMSFGFLIAYIYNGKLWQRVLLFLSTIPITVLMNSFRIGVIGVTVEYWGIEMAEGFLHDFEGWVIFISCLGILLIEIIIFHKLAGKAGSIWDELDLDTPESLANFKEFLALKKVSLQNIAAFLMIGILAFLVPNIGGVQEEYEIGERKAFSVFPLVHQGWSGRSATIAPDVLKVLNPTDYFKADYIKDGVDFPINFYTAYYEQQTKGGAAIHSPRSCIPGGGWKISDLSVITLDNIIGQEGKPLKLNRFVITKGESRQLVYFWIEQGGRNLTNEYLGRWYLFKDSLFKSRTDGALVRVIGQVPEAVKIEDVEADMQQFIADFYPKYLEFLPSDSVE